MNKIEKESFEGINEKFINGLLDAVHLYIVKFFSDEEWATEGDKALFTINKEVCQCIRKYFEIKADKER